MQIEEPLYASKLSLPVVSGMEYGRLPVFVVTLIREGIKILLYIKWQTLYQGAFPRFALQGGLEKGCKSTGRTNDVCYLGGSTTTLLILWLVFPPCDRWPSDRRSHALVILRTPCSTEKSRMGSDGL